MKKVHLVTVMMLVLLPFLLFGGGKAEVKKAVTINVILDEREDFRKLRDKTPEFTKLTGINVNVELLPETEMRDKINIDLMSGAATYDLILMGFMHEAAYLQAGLLEPLDDYIANKKDPAIGSSMDWIPTKGAYADSLHIWKGKRYGLPYYCVNIESNMLLFNAQMLADKGITISKIPTIYELEAAAAALTDKEKGIYGWAMRGIKGQSQWVFASIAQMFGGRILDMKTHEVTINSPEMIKALEWYTMMDRKYGPPDVANWGWYEVMEAWATGKVAMIQDSGVLSFYALGVKGQVVQRNMGGRVMGQLPGRPTSTGIWSFAMAMPKSSKHKDEAWKFLQWMYREDVARVWRAGFTEALAKDFFDQCKVAKGERPLIDTVVEAIETQDASFYEVRKLKEAAEIFEILSAAVSASVSGAQDPESALNEAHDLIYNLLKS